MILNVHVVAQNERDRSIMELLKASNPQQITHDIMIGSMYYITGTPDFVSRVMLAMDKLEKLATK